MLALVNPGEAAALPGRVREFFALFYSMELGEAQIRQLLSSHPRNPYAAIPGGPGAAFEALR
ncbi:hypothetical protein D3C78_1852970 [compost metagenome]